MGMEWHASLFHEGKSSTYLMHSTADDGNRARLTRLSTPRRLHKSTPSITTLLFTVPQALSKSAIPSTSILSPVSTSPVSLAVHHS